MEGKALVQYVTYKRPKTTMLLRISADLSGYPLRGDALTDARTLEDCYWYMLNVVNAISSLSAYKYHNPVKVTKEAKRIVLKMEGVSTEKITEVCAFELIEN